MPSSSYRPVNHWTHRFLAGIWRALSEPCLQPQLQAADGPNDSHRAPAGSNPTTKHILAPSILSSGAGIKQISPAIVTDQSRRVGRAVLCTPKRRPADVPARRAQPDLPLPATTEALTASRWHDSLSVPYQHAIAWLLA